MYARGIYVKTRKGVHGNKTYYFFYYYYYYYYETEKGCDSGFPYCFLTDYTKFFL